MATNVTEKDKTLQEIIDWCEQLEIDGLRLANALLMQRDTTAYGVVKGQSFRVLKEHGVLIFKWNETQIPVSQILKLTAHKPLFGNKQPNRTGTHWIVFMKEDAK